MPPSIFIPRILEYNMDTQPEENNAHLALNFYKDLTHSAFPDKLTKNTYFKLNPFFVLTKVSDLPQKSEDLADASYIVNGLFGNEDYSSIVRVLLTGESKSIETICDTIMKWRTSYSSPNIFYEARTAQQLITGVEQAKQGLEILRNLLYNGVLVMVPQK